MTKIDIINNLREKIETLEREVSRSEGAYEEAQKALEKDFKCKDIASAKKLLKKLDIGCEEAKTEFDSALAEFEEKWGDTLE